MNKGIITLMLSVVLQNSFGQFKIQSPYIFEEGIIYFNGNSQPNTYEVYAIRYGSGWFMKLSDIAVGASEKDSIGGCHMF